jgi:hypothetical protein
MPWLPRILVFLAAPIAFCLFEAQMQSGNEPPLHLQQGCDVVLYVLEGEMDVYCGTEVRTAERRSRGGGLRRSDGARTWRACAGYRLRYG